MTKAYNFERDLLERCRVNGLSRIIQVLGKGKVQLDPSASASVVEYLIMELADGDIRTYLAAIEELDLAWACRTAHHAAVGLQQLHGLGIAHQDLKPSNVLVFGSDSAKLGDLGRAADRRNSGPFDHLSCAGDLGYAPIELRYGFEDPDWGRRRAAGDLYLLGSLIMFLFADMGATPAIIAELHVSHRNRPS